MLGLSRLGFEHLIFQSSKHIGIKDISIIYRNYFDELKDGTQNSSEREQ